RVFSRQVHRVRSALEEGLPDDPDLTGDLTVPIQQIRQDSGYDDGYTRGEPPPDSQPIRHDTIVVPVDNGRPTGAPAKTPAPPRRRSRGPIALILILAVAIAIGTSAWYYGIHRYTSTPELVNMSPAAAADAAAKAGLKTSTDNQDYSEDVRAGDVMGTDPAAGERVRKDGTIGPTASKRPERYR